jgi:hypothetical protein
LHVLRLSLLAFAKLTVSRDLLVGGLATGHFFDELGIGAALCSTKLAFAFPMRLLRWGRGQDRQILQRLTWRRGTQYHFSALATVALRVARIFDLHG